jgi:hypothetical protein
MKTYHIEHVLTVSKSSLKKKIWSQSEGSPEAVAAIDLLNRRGPNFTLDELVRLSEWLTWSDAAADGHSDAVTPLTEWRDRQCAKRDARALKNIQNLRAHEEALAAENRQEGAE